MNPQQTEALRERIKELAEEEVISANLISACLMACDEVLSQALEREREEIREGVLAMENKQGYCTFRGDKFIGLIEARDYVRSLLSPTKTNKE